MKATRKINQNFENFLVENLKKPENNNEISDQNNSNLAPDHVFYMVLLRFINLLFRLFVLFYQQLVHPLTHFFVSILEPITVNECTNKDSFHFAEELLISNLNLVMASFNVELLFKNIPLQLLIFLLISYFKVTPV